MSIEIAKRLTSGLPYSIREQVLGYARSVNDALPAIQAEAHVSLTEAEQERLLLIATLRKLHGICSSSYWAVENAGVMLSRAGQGSVRIGATNYSRGGDFHRALESMLDDLNELLLEADISDEWLRARYNDVAQWIVDER